MILIFLL